MVNQLINVSRSDHYRQRIDEAESDARQRWKIVSELLHSNDNDKTRTDDQNRNLCSTFGHYFVSKIAKLRDSVSYMLPLLSASVDSDLSFSPHHGPMLDMLYPVIARTH